MRNSWLTNDGVNATQALNQEVGEVQLTANDRRVHHDAATRTQASVTPSGKRASAYKYQSVNV